MKEKSVKPIFFYLGMGAVFVFLMIRDNPRKDTLSIVAFVSALSSVVLLSIVDKWLHPDVYTKKKDRQKRLF